MGPYAPANPLARFEHHDLNALVMQLARCRDSGSASANHHNVELGAFTRHASTQAGATPYGAALR